MYRIRRTTDVETLTVLHLDIFPDDIIPAFNLGWWWIATHKGDPVGFAGTHPSQRWSDTGYLIRAGVREDHRGRRSCWPAAMPAAIRRAVQA